MFDFSNKRIILSKTNRIGDAIVALPVAGRLKKAYPSCEVIFLGQAYTRDIVQQYRYVDEFVAWDELEAEDRLRDGLAELNADVIIHLKPRKQIAFAAKQAGIPLRVGTYERPYHWFTCNKIVNVVRKRQSPLHDAQMDMLYFTLLTDEDMLSRRDLAALMSFREFASDAAPSLRLLNTGRFNLILHTKSMTDAGKREWPLESFAKVIEALPKEKFQIFLTGTETDGEAIRETLCQPYPHVVDLTGKQTLGELMQFISKADGLVGGSTGPLHIAAAFGVRTLGLYTPVLGHHPSRWGPIGQRAEYLVSPRQDCRACGKDGICFCIRDITPQHVIERVQHWYAAQRTVSV